MTSAAIDPSTSDSSFDLADGDGAIIRELNERVSRLRVELSGLETDDSKHASCRQQLTQALMDLFENTKDEGVLDEILFIQRRALTSGRDWMCHHVLSACLAERFKRTRDPAVLAEAISHGRLAHELCPDDPSNKHLVCGNLIGLLQEHDVQSPGADTLNEQSALLAETIWSMHMEDKERVLPPNLMALAYEERYKQTKDAKLLEELISFQREVLRDYPSGHPERTAWLEPLARSLVEHWEKRGDLASLEEAIVLYREMIKLCPRTHPDQRWHCQAMASILYKHITSTGQDNSLDEAIEITRELLDRQGEGHPERFRTLASLSDLLGRLFDRTGEDLVLDEIWSLRKEAFALCPVGHADRAAMGVKLALTLIDKSAVTSDLALLDEGVALERDSAQLYGPGTVDQATTLGNLVFHLGTRFERFGDTADLDEAVALGREAYAICPPNNSSRTQIAQQLAWVLHLQYQHGGDQASLIEALQLATHVLHNSPPAGQEHASACDTLAQLLTEVAMMRRRRVEAPLLLHMDAETACRTAIAYHREVVAVRPPGTRLGAAACHNLAVSLMELYHVTGDLEPLNEAVSLQETAVKSVQAGQIDLGTYQSGLADGLREQFRHSGDKATLARVIALMNAAVDATPRTHPQYWQRCTELAQMHVLTEHDASCHVNHEDSVRYALQNIETAVQSGAEVTNVFDLTRDLAQILSRVDIARTDQDVLLRLLSLYDYLLRLIPLVSNLALDGRQRLDRTTSLISARGAESQAFACAVRAGKLSVGIEMLEQARGLFWSQTLMLRGPQSRDLPPEIASELDILLQELARDEDTSLKSAAELAAERDRRHNYDHRVKKLLRTVHTLPGRQGFMYGPSFEAIAQIAWKGNPVVILVAAQDGAHAVIMDGSPASPIHVSLGAVTLTGLADMGAGIRGVQARGSTLPADDPEENSDRAMHITNRKRPVDAVAQETNALLARIWREIVQPIFEALRVEKKGPSDSGRPRLHWCPTGQFSFIPFHAAGLYEGGDQVCCSDYVVSSYTPTISALVRARASPICLRRNQLSVLLIAEGNAPGMPRLPLVEQEVREVSEILCTSSVPAGTELGRSPTIAQVSEALPSASIVHLACHGLQSATDALDSGFCLHDERLTIARLMALQLDGAAVAFLSACETAKGDARQPDQTVHLAAAMLFAGFKSVVATMWSMNDADGPTVAKVFYEALLAKPVIDQDSVPFALDAAIQWLRERGVPPYRWATFIHMGA